MKLVVLTCLKYSYLWGPMLNQIECFWKGGPVVVGTDDGVVPGNYKQIRSGDQRFGATLLHTIKRMDDDYIFLLLDDMFLVDSVCAQLLSECEGFLKRHEGDQIRFNTWSSLYTPCRSFRGPMRKKATRLTKRSPYLVSLQPSIWRKDFLESVVREEESAWDTEGKGSLRARSLEPVVFHVEFPVAVNTVERGVIAKTPFKKVLHAARREKP